MQTAPNGRRVDPEHPAGLLGSETEPLDEEQSFPLAAGEPCERTSDVMARRHGPAEIFGRNGGEDTTSPDHERADAAPMHA